MNPVHLFFHWPEGSVWSNIIASAIWSLPLWGAMLWRIEKHHKEHAQRQNFHHLQIKNRLDKLIKAKENK